MKSKTREIVDRIRDKLADVMKDIDELDKQPFEERDFSKKISDLLGNTAQVMEHLASRIRGAQVATLVELSLRFERRCRFHCAEEGKHNNYLLDIMSVGSAWLDPEHAFAEKERKEKSNAAAIEKGLRGVRPRKFAVYGYTPQTGKFKKYDTLEEARKDEFSE